MKFLRALSLSQPWAWCMTMPAWGLRKDVENRTWKCPANMIGHRFAIHAAKSWDDNGARMIHEAGLRFPPQATIARGAIVALATIDRMVTSADELPLEQRRWFFGPFGYVFRDLAVLRKPVPCRGMQSFWKVPDAHLAEIVGQLVLDAREWAVDHCQYSQDRVDILVDAVRRTGRRGRDLDDAAWDYANGGPGNVATVSKGELSRSWLETVGATP